MENQNQENISEQKIVNDQSSSGDKVINRNNIVKVLFALVIVFFFFNFLTISCAGKEIVSSTGMEIIINTNETNDIVVGEEKISDIIPLNTWLIITLACAVTGLVIYFVNPKNKGLIGVSLGVIGLVALIVFQIIIWMSVDKDSKDIIVIEFGLAYWGSLIAMFAASILSFLEMKNVKR